MIDGRNIESPAPRHLSHGLFVHICSVLDRVRSRSHGVPCAVRPVGVNRQLAAESVRGISRRLDLVECEGLEARHILSAPCRSIHLDHVGPGRHLLPNNAEHFGHAIGRSSWWEDIARPRVTARYAQSVPRYEHPRSGHRASVDQIAHGDVGILRRP